MQENATRNIRTGKEELKQLFMQCFFYPENFKLSMETLLPKIKELSKIIVNKINA